MRIIGRIVLAVVAFIVTCAAGDTAPPVRLSSNTTAETALEFVPAPSITMVNWRITSSSNANCPAGKFDAPPDNHCPAESKVCNLRDEKDLAAMRLAIAPGVQLAVQGVNL